MQLSSLPRAAARPAADVVRRTFRRVLSGSPDGRPDWVRALEEELTPTQVDGRGDIAFARGTLSLLLDQKGAVKHDGTFLTVLRKQSDGSWRMAAYSVAY